jgi:hypothetical protein
MATASINIVMRLAGFDGVAGTDQMGDVLTPECQITFPTMW